MNRKISAVYINSEPFGVPLDNDERSCIINHMVNNNPMSLNHTFAALADPTRRAILARLTRGEASVTELARPFQVSLHRIRLNPKPLRQAAGWLSRYERFWSRRLDALEAYLRKTQKEEKR
jgi:DNA-binding transcriptional ArsR family regulator